MSDFFDDAVHTLETLVQTYSYRGGSPVPDDEYELLAANDEVNRILKETGFTPPKRGRSRKRERGRPLSSSKNKEEKQVLITIFWASRLSTGMSFTFCPTFRTRCSAASSPIPLTPPALLTKTAGSGPPP